jgi:hypothetical protein
MKHDLPVNTLNIIMSMLRSITLIYPAAYLHQQESRYEGASLTVADLSVKDGVSLEHVEEALLAKSVSLLEERVFRECPGQVTLDGPLVRGHFL